MKYKSKKLAAVIIGGVVIWLITVNFLGIGTVSSGTRIGYVENSGWGNWSANYTMLDGKYKHTIYLKDTQKTLHVEVVTESGNISMEMKDANGNIIFDRENMETSTFAVKASEKVVIRIEANRHKGSFNMEAAE